MKIFKEKADDFHALRTDLSKYEKLFTPGQRKRILTGKQTHWQEEDISMAMSLHSAGSKAYKLLLKRGVPLPDVRTLKRYAASIHIQPGFLEPVLSVLAENTESDLAKYCVLSFDEVKVRQCYEYDASRKRVLRPVDQALVMMVKGLCTNWQQVVYYNYDKRPTKKLLNNVLANIEKCGLVPVAMVCDMGPKNVATFNELGVTVKRPYFISTGGNKIFTFADTPHLLKLLRNHFLDKGFNLDGQYIGSRPVARLLDLQGVDIGIAYRITPEHFPPRGSPKRQNVKKAAQIFSNSVSAALLRLLNLTSTGQFTMPDETKATAEFLKLINDWFDIFNTRRPINDSRPTQKAFGLKGAFKQQVDILVKVYNVIGKMRAYGRLGKLPFQRGIQQNIRAILELHQHMKNISAGAVKYIMTDRLNQDCLERFFGYLRSKGGGLNDHPSPLELKYRLRASIVGV